VTPPAPATSVSCAATDASAMSLSTKIAAETRMKRTPTLTFHYDPTVVQGMRISQLLEDEGER